MEAILTFRNYTTTKLKKGMLFFVINVDSGEPFIYKLNKLPQGNNIKEFIKLMGCPVLPYIVSQSFGKHTIATPDQIEWVDVVHFNEILSIFDGKIDIKMENDEKPLFIDGKIVISYFTKHLTLLEEEFYEYN